MLLSRRLHTRYTGCTVNFKTYTNSIWDKKQRENPAENQAVFYGTHPAIIQPEVFEKVQEIRQQRHRQTKTGKSGNRRQGVRIVYDLVGYIPLDELIKQETA